MPQISQDHMLAKLSEIFSDELDHAGLTLALSDTPDTVEDWDSLAQIRIMAAIEQEFDFQFDLEQLDELYSVQAICAAIEANLRA